MAAVYEWRITDLGNGQFGCIWISENGKDEFGEMYRVWVDPTNLDAVATAVFKYDANSLFNLECPEDDAWYSRILFYWKRMGSPRIDRKAAGYEAPWFPWTEAGFTDDERDGCIKLVATASDSAEDAEVFDV